MKLRIDRAELLTELLPMQGVVERKSTIPVLSHLLLKAKDGKLHLAATDLDVSLTSWCDGEVAEDGALAVQARKFVEIVRAVTEPTLSLSADESNTLVIEAGKSRFKIHGLSAEDFPTLPEVSDASRLAISYPEFKGMVSKIFFAVSAEESRFQLNGALLKSKDGSLELVATDGHRLALVERPHDEAKDQDGVLIPRKALQELQRFDSEDDLEFRRGDHHLSFRLGRRELICRILEGTFPDYEKVISKDNDQSATFDKKPLGEVVHRVALLTGDRSRAVRMKFAADLMTLSAANPDLGEAVEELGCEYGGREMEIGINPDYLSQFLSVVGTDSVRFDLKDENSQCIGFPVDGEDLRYLCVIMPMRL